MLHYLPGCDVRNNHPQAVFTMQRYMERQGAIIDTCCRVENKFLKDGDVIINNCTLCNIILNESHPDNECLSLYEYVLKDREFPWKNYHGARITIQDCWRTRDNISLQNAVRQCLLRMNFELVEMDKNYSKTEYCGVWLNNPPAKDCIKVAPKTFHNITENYTRILPQEMQIERMESWVAQYTTEQVLVYCNGCERGIKLGGGKPLHIIELLASGMA